MAETCPNGEYSSTTGQTTCVTCTEGYQCLDKTAAPVICPAGTYSAAGSMSCTSCPTGQCEMLPVESSHLFSFARGNPATITCCNEML